MDIELSRLFVKVVQNASFSRAAETLKIPKSTVSKAISRLENETGTKLLLRTTRSLTLTAAGRAYYETCLGPIQVLEDAQKSLYGKDSILAGLVRITAPEDFSGVLAPLIKELTTHHQALSFELHLSDEIVDLVKDGFDFAIRIGKLSESNLKSKKIGDVELIPVASPSYLKNSEKIRRPKDIENHICLALQARSSTTQWFLKNKKEHHRLKINPKIVSNQMTSLLQLAEAGAGISLVPRFLACEALRQGRLQRILPDWCGTSMPVSLLSPLSTMSSARLKLASENIFKEIHKALNT